MPSTELAGGNNIGDIPPDQLRAGQCGPPSTAPECTPPRLATVQLLRAMGPAIILSTHMPPAIGQTAQFLDMLAGAPDADPFVGPDQHALEQMLAGFEPVTAAELTRSQLRECSSLPLKAATLA